MTIRRYLSIHTYINTFYFPQLILLYHCLFTFLLPASTDVAAGILHALPSPAAFLPEGNAAFLLPRAGMRAKA